jgi:hypothetical protein
MKTKISFLLLLSIILLTACEKEITLTLPSPKNQLVVEGRLERVQGQPTQRHTIILSKVNDYFDNEQTPRVTDAIVTVREPSGVTHVFVHGTAKPGTYVNTTLVPTDQLTYTLHIEWNNELYEATETFTNVAEIERIYQQFEEENQFEDGGIKVAIDFTDPSGTGDNYLWELFLDGENVLVPDPGNSGNIVATDKFFDGETVEGYFPNEEKVFTPGQQVLVRQIGISRNQYDYLFILLEQTGQTGQLIDVPAAPIRGNVRNLTNPGKPALGYFGVNEISEKLIIIQ